MMQEFKEGHSVTLLVDYSSKGLDITEGSVGTVVVDAEKNVSVRFTEPSATLTEDGHTVAYALVSLNKEDARDVLKPL